MLNIMENTFTTDNNLVKSITGILKDPSAAVSPVVDATAYSSPIFTNGDTSSGFFSFFENLSWYVWVIIILILAFLGINIFSYLAQGTQDVTDILKPITSLFGKLFSGTILETTKQTINLSNEGVNAIAQTSSDTISQAQNQLSGGSSTTYTPPKTSSSSTSTSSSGVQGDMARTKQQNQMEISPNGATLEHEQEDSLEKALSDAKKSTNVEADDSFSSIQKASGKAGWCYIGEEKGIRSCLQVGVNDLCLSGDIFPTQDVCINPNLRP